MPVDVTHRFGFGGYTALHRASMHNRTDVVKRLLQEGADMDRQNHYGKNTPLHYAALYNSTEVARLLIDKRADINLKGEFNKTPLDRAHKGTEVERLLLELQQSAP